MQCSVWDPVRLTLSRARLGRRVLFNPTEPNAQYYATPCEYVIATPSQNRI
jgi:hypothetical protein